MVFFFRRVVYSTPRWPIHLLGIKSTSYNDLNFKYSHSWLWWTVGCCSISPKWMWASVWDSNIHPRWASSDSVISFQSRPTKPGFNSLRPAQTDTLSVFFGSDKAHAHEYSEFTEHVKPLQGLSLHVCLACPSSSVPLCFPVSHHVVMLFLIHPPPAGLFSQCISDSCLGSLDRAGVPAEPCTRGVPRAVCWSPQCSSGFLPGHCHSSVLIPWAGTAGFWSSAVCGRRAWTELWALGSSGTTLSCQGSRQGSAWLCDLLRDLSAGFDIWGRFETSTSLKSSSNRPVVAKAAWGWVAHQSRQLLLMAFS